MKECTHLKDILDAEIKIIKNHIEEHKWYQHISNDNDAINDFIQKYGFIMREFYCSYICEERDDCDIAKKYINGNGK